MLYYKALWIMSDIRHRALELPGHANADGVVAVSSVCEARGEGEGIVGIEPVGDRAADGLRLAKGRAVQCIAGSSRRRRHRGVAHRHRRGGAGAGVAPDAVEIEADSRDVARSDERRGGKEVGRTCITWWSPHH